MPSTTITANQRNTFHHHPESLICTQLDTMFPEPAEGRKVGLARDPNLSKYCWLQASRSTSPNTAIYDIKRYKQMLEFRRLVKEQLSQKKEFQKSNEYLDN